MKPLKSFNANFTLLGERRYVQGSTLTEGLLAALKIWDIGPVERIQGNFRFLMHEQGRYDLLATKNPRNKSAETYKVHFQIKCAETNILVGVKGLGEPVTKSVPYDEEGLITGSAINLDQRSASVMLASSTRFINTIIALNKRLVSHVFSEEGYDQWFLSRYDLIFDRTHIETQRLLIIRVASSIGASNTISTVMLDDNPVGTIYFSRNFRR